MLNDGPFTYIHSLEAEKLGDGLKSALSPAVLRSLSVRAIFLADPEDIVVVDQELDPGWIGFLEGTGMVLPNIRVANGTGETLVKQITNDTDLLTELCELGYPIKPYMGSVENQSLAHQLGLRYHGPENELVDHLNHKSNLDPILAEIGLPRIPTTVCDFNEILNNAHSAFEQYGPLMIRSDLSIGGHGVWKIEDISDINQLRLGIQSAKPGRKFIWQPLKAVTHSPNVQFEIMDELITPLGVSAQQMTESFAFGGNAFPSPLSQSAGILEQSKKIVQWLQSQGYRGLVGIDFIVTIDSEVYIVEINPRVNTSTFPLVLSQRLEAPAFQLLTGFPVQTMDFAELVSIIGSDLMFDQDRGDGIVPLMIPTDDRRVCDIMVFSSSLDGTESIVEQLNDRLASNQASGSTHER